MLVLTRKLGQQLVIGDNVVVTVLSVRNGQVRLGIEAPRSVSIRREELEALPAMAAREAEAVVAQTGAGWE
jgi:carbon storage regulator CsrA